MNFKPVILPLFLAASLGSIYFLPHTGKVSESAIIMNLPANIGEWYLQNLPPSQDEIRILGKDTKFAKALCYRARPGEFASDGRIIPDRADLSVVLSGYDMNNSIHRPERCMPAQGHNILSSKDINIKLSNGKTLTVRRLRSVQTITNPQDRKKDAKFECITYYVFVGHDRIEHDHLQRTIADMEDRLIRGTDPRWAYISASMWFGKIPWIEPLVTEQEADAKLVNLVAQFAERQIRWDQVTR